MPPEIDVVIPVYNGQAFLECAVNSVLAQSLPAKNIIIVDDGSTDETARVIEKLADIHPRISPILLPHGGVSATRNAGINASNSPYIAFLDADDEWLADKLEKQWSVFENATAETGVVHCSYMHIDEENKVICENNVTPPKKRGDLFNELLFDHYVLSGSASAVLIKRCYLDQAGYFDENLFQGEDWDLWIRLASICHYDFAEEALVKIRVHPYSAQRKYIEDKEIIFLKQHLIIFGKWYGKTSFPTKLIKTMRDDVCRMCITNISSVSRLIMIYKTLNASDNPLGKNLFKNWFDFAFCLGKKVLRHAYWKAKRICYLILRPLLHARS